MLFKVTKSKKRWWPFSGHKTSYIALQNGSVEMLNPGLGFVSVKVTKGRVFSKRTLKKQIIGQNVNLKDMF